MDELIKSWEEIVSSLEGKEMSCKASYESRIAMIQEVRAAYQACIRDLKARIIATE